MTDRELLQQALPCCGYADTSAVKWNTYNGVVQCHNCGQTYTPLARPEQEPVAHVYLFEPNGRPRVAWDNAKDIKIGDKLYTATPQRKPLTHPQIHEFDWPDGVSFEDILLFVRAIEAAHGI